MGIEIVSGQLGADGRLTISLRVPLPEKSACAGIVDILLRAGVYLVVAGRSGCAGCGRRSGLCRGGGIGRRARLRGVWSNPYGFKSRPRHQMTGFLRFRSDRVACP